MSPSARTVQYYRDKGWLCATVEKWIAPIKKRIDLFHCFDQIMVRPGQTWGIQTCVGRGDVAKHAAKLLSIPEFHRWIEYGNHAIIISWAVRGARGKRKKWTPVEHVYHPNLKRFVQEQENVPSEVSEGNPGEQVPIFFP